MEQIKEVIKNRRISRDGLSSRIKYEFQAYGQRLAKELGDLQRETLYMKLGKEVDRRLIEQAREYVLGSENVRNRGALFMYKLKQLRDKYSSVTDSAE